MKDIIKKSCDIESDFESKRNGWWATKITQIHAKFFFYLHVETGNTVDNALN